MINLDEATPVFNVSGVVLVESTEEPGKLIWHAIKHNLQHPDHPNGIDFHEAECGARLFGVAHQSTNGHHPCPVCFP
jgi:hypothetical protein